MFILSHSYHLIVIFNVIFSGALIIYCIFKYRKVKEISHINLLLIYNELEYEKKSALHLKAIPQKIRLIEQNTQQKLQRIKVEVFNIDFSVHEIFY